MDQLSFFDLNDRLEQISKIGDPLEVLNEIVDWSKFDSILLKAKAKDLTVRKVNGSEQKNNPRDDSKNDLVSMFKTQLHFYYPAPFKYGYRCIKERNYIGLVLFAAFISVPALIFVW